MGIWHYINKRDRGKYILIEGGDGSGKGTQISEIFRNIVLEKKDEILSPQAELFTYLDARSQVTLHVVKPALEIIEKEVQKYKNQ